MSVLQSFLFRYPRLTGLLCLIGGFFGSCDLLWSYYAGGIIFGRTFTYTPLVIILGLGILIEPRILLAWNKFNEPPVPFKFKIVGLLLLTIAMGIGMYLELVVFKDWKSGPL